MARRCRFPSGSAPPVENADQGEQAARGVEIDLELPADLRKYVIVRGSIALDGISLTVAEKTDTGVRVAIIPETIRKTRIADWQPGSLVNVEVDMIGKYVENYLREAGIVPKA